MEYLFRICCGVLAVAVLIWECLGLYWHSLMIHCKCGLCQEDDIADRVDDAASGLTASYLCFVASTKGWKSRLRQD